MFEFFKKLKERVEDNAMNAGKIHALSMKFIPRLTDISDAEFKVFSQWGEDGIIQYIISRIDIPDKTFIEFGVESYIEANTRFLLMNNNWRGIVMDGSRKNIEKIKRDRIYWRYEIHLIHSHITRNNINELIKRYTQSSDVGLLSIDIDGNDYWIWKEIHVIQPRIVICEYNGLFGNQHAVTIPYQENFSRKKAHFSNLYFGASLSALCHLAHEKGYDFIGCNSNGNNAFFIRKDLSSAFNITDPIKGFVYPLFRESRGKNGRFNFISGEERIKSISHLEVYDIKREKTVFIKELLNDGHDG